MTMLCFGTERHFVSVWSSSGILRWPFLCIRTSPLRFVVMQISSFIVCWPRPSISGHVLTQRYFKNQTSLRSAFVNRNNFRLSFCKWHKKALLHFILRSFSRSPVFNEWPLTVMNANTQLKLLKIWASNCSRGPLSGEHYEDGNTLPVGVHKYSTIDPFRPSFEFSEFVVETIPGYTTFLCVHRRLPQNRMKDDFIVVGAFDKAVDLMSLTTGLIHRAYLDVSCIWIVWYTSGQRPNTNSH